MKKQYEIPSAETWRLDAEDALLTGVSQQTHTAESYADEEDYGGF